MPMTYEEKLRSEFKESYWNWATNNLNVLTHEQREEVGNIILEFFLQHHIEFVESVRSEITELLDDPKVSDVKALILALDVLSLPSLTVTNK